jgi:hypothetical protein
MLNMLVKKAPIHTLPKILLYALPLLFALLSGRQAKAQEAFERGFTGVISAGLNASQVDGDGLSGFNMPGAMIGVGAIYNYSEKVSFGPEFFFAQKGARSTQDDIAKRGLLWRIRTNYIEIPVLVHYNAKPGFSLCAGPSFGAILSSNIESNTTPPRTKTPGLWRGVDVGAVGGFEFKIYQNLYFGGRWFYSVLPAENSPLSTYNTYNVLFRGSGLRNNTISVLLRLKL